MGLVLLLSSFTVLAQEENTTVYLIRHAEKVKTDPTNRNPHLNNDGKMRSVVWAEFFKDIPLDAIFSTEYHRTQETVTPLAKSKQLTIQTYAPNNKTVDSIVSANIGKQLLFVGHSNTIPNHCNQLISEKRFSDMSEHDNHSLFIVQRSSTNTEVVRIFVD